jgi:hypothetical protein
MLRGVWTYKEGTRQWFESEFDGIFDIELPDEFATAVVTHPLPFEYKFLCLTVRYKQYRMGVCLVDSNFDRKQFLGDVYED